MNGGKNPFKQTSPTTNQTKPKINQPNKTQEKQQTKKTKIKVQQDMNEQSWKQKLDI